MFLLGNGTGPCVSDEVTGYKSKVNLLISHIYSVIIYYLMMLRGGGGGGGGSYSLCGGTYLKSTL